MAAAEHVTATSGFSIPDAVPRIWRNERRHPLYVRGARRSAEYGISKTRKPVGSRSLHGLCSQAGARNGSGVPGIIIAPRAVLVLFRKLSDHSGCQRNSAQDRSAKRAGSILEG